LPLGRRELPTLEQQRGGEGCCEGRRVVQDRRGRKESNPIGVGACEGRGKKEWGFPGLGGTYSKEEGVKNNRARKRPRQREKTDDYAGLGRKSFQGERRFLSRYQSPESHGGKRHLRGERKKKDLKISWRRNFFVMLPEAGVQKKKII